MFIFIKQGFKLFLNFFVYQNNSDIDCSFSPVFFLRFYLLTRLRFLVTELEKQAAKEHNFYRSLHDSNATLLDYNLNVDARRYAEELAQEGRLVQTNQEVLRGKNQGENLAKDCSKYDLQRKMKRAINRW